MYCEMSLYTHRNNGDKTEALLIYLIMFYVQVYLLAKLSVTNKF
jgi:hypothetical protein